MADQYSTGDSSVDLTTSDSKKRPLDGAGDGRPSYKRSNLGGKHSCESFPIGVWKLRSLWGVLFCHVALRRQVEIFTPFHLSAVCRSFMAWKIGLSGVRSSPTSATTTRVLNCERSVKKLRFYTGKIGLFGSRIQRVGNINKVESTWHRFMLNDLLWFVLSCIYRTCKLLIDYTGRHKPGRISLNLWT